MDTAVFSTLYVTGVKLYRKQPNRANNIPELREMSSEREISSHMQSHNTTLSQDHHE